MAQSPEPIPERAVLASHYVSCFSTASGQKVLADLESRFCDITQPVFVKEAGSMYDPLEAAIRDGRRQVVDTIKLQIRNHEQRLDKPKQRKARK